MKTYGIVADSSADFNQQQQKEYGVDIVPLSMLLGDKVFVDNNNLDVDAYMDEMKNCKEKIGSACPSPNDYCQAFEKYDSSYAVTLSSSLSGSYSSAVTGAKLAEESGKEVYVFDSKSASAGEVLVSLKTRELIDKAISRAHLIETVEKYINELKTYFVLDNVDNFVKNGRLSKVKGKIISTFGIKPILGSDGNGNITLFSHGRGQKQILEKMAGLVGKCGKNVKGLTACITHCSNENFANALADILVKTYGFADVIVMKTRGLSSMYANKLGVILSF